MTRASKAYAVIASPNLLRVAGVRKTGIMPVEIWDGARLRMLWSGRVGDTVRLMPDKEYIISTVLPEVGVVAHSVKPHPAEKVVEVDLPSYMRDVLASLNEPLQQEAAHDDVDLGFSLRMYQGNLLQDAAQAVRRGWLGSTRRRCLIRGD